MIIQNALSTNDPERSTDYDASVAHAAPLFQQRPGWLGIALQRGVQRPAQYRLMIRWEILDYPTESFRNSANCQSCRGVVRGALRAQYVEYLG